MKKKLIAILILCFILCMALCSLSSCTNDGGNSDSGGQNPPVHTHIYNKKILSKY